MAQYFQVLSQENPNIQYVIAPESQQQHLQGQQIVVSGDQLVVIENTGQQVILNQAGNNAFQNAQYIIQQETVPTYSNVRTAPTQRQVFYTTEASTDSNQLVQVQQTPSPIVLNHQLPRTQSSSNVQKTVLSTGTARLSQMQQSRPLTNALRHTNMTQVQTGQQPQTVIHTQTTPQSQGVVVPQTQSIVQQQQPRQLLTQSLPAQVQVTLAVSNAPQRSPQQKMLLNRSVFSNSSGTNTTGLPVTVAQRINQLSQSEVQTANVKIPEVEEGVCLQDGSIMPMSNYNLMLAGKKKAANASSSQAEELDAPTQLDATRKDALPKPRGGRVGAGTVCVVGRGGRARRVNVRSSVPNTNLTLAQPQQETELKTAQAQQRFIAQGKIAQQQQQLKAKLPPNQFMQRQQLLQQQQQQQALLRQQQQQLQLQQQQQVQQQQQPYVQPQYIIQPPSMHLTPPQCTLPPYVVSSQIQQIIENTPVSDEFPDSIRMLVLLESGEQRLITFTLPKEMCTIQEILEQVGVPFQSDTRIDCHETSYPGINYLVTVGMHPEHYPVTEETVVEVTTQNSEVQTTSQEVPPQPQSLPQLDMAELSPELLSETEVPRYVSGLVAICAHCGYSSENFNQCLRCKFKLPNEVKTAMVGAKCAQNGDLIIDKKITINLKTPVLDANKVTSSTVLNDNIFNDKKKVKTKLDPEPDVLTLSSDEEDGGDASNLSETDQLLKRFNNSSVTLSAIKKEPTLTDLQQSMVSSKNFTVAVKGGGKEDNPDSGPILVAIRCRTIRIGSYKYTPKYDFIVKPLEVILKVPLPFDNATIKTIVIERKHVAKVLVNFQKALPVIFYYVNPSLAETIRSDLGMEPGSNFYFDPVSSEEAFKRITILPEIVTDEIKVALKEIYGKPPNICMDELTTKEANDILVKTCPKEISKFVESTIGIRSFSPEVKQLLIYPPGKGGLPINTEDYMCLAQDQFLNDVIIDFYLKFLLLQLPMEEQTRIHIFSTFFYKRLTTKPVKASRRSHPAELDPNLTPAQRRHARVEKWTKNVNLFEKDFIIVPINENCHWYLAIICYPSLNGCFTLDGRQIQIEQRPRVSRLFTIGTIGTVTITNIKKEREKPIVCDDDEGSDKDEAEGDDSELETDSCDESENPIQPQLEINDPNTDIRQPCILIFDSLAGASRARVVATLRDYLTCEYKAKCGIDKVFNKDVIKGNCPKVPQQTNFTDCGLYLLQYVEHFLSHPIRNYHIPIRHLREWFDEHTVTKKREDIAMLIKDLMTKYNIDTSCVPILTLPTLNGKIVDNFEDEDELMHDYEEEDDEEEEEELEEDASNEYLNSSLETQADVESTPDSENSPELHSNQINIQEELPSGITLIPKPSGSKRVTEFAEETVLNETELKPDISELQQNNKIDTLSYLKAKRINRHKNSDVVDIKKFKASYE